MTSKIMASTVLALAAAAFVLSGNSKTSSTVAADDVRFAADHAELAVVAGDEGSPQAFPSLKYIIGIRP